MRLHAIILLGSALASVLGATACATNDAPSENVESAPSALKFHVVDQSSRHGIAGAAINIVDTRNNVVFSAFTDGGGNVELKFPAAGKYSVTATKRSYSIGITGFDTSTLPANGDAFITIGTLQGATSIGERSGGPGQADVETEIGRSLVEARGSSPTALVYFQGPALAGDKYPVPMFGIAGRTYEVVELDAATLSPLVTEPVTVASGERGLFDHLLSERGRAAMSTRGVLLAMTLEGDVDVAPSGLHTRDTTTPIYGGTTVGVGQSFPSTCGPASATCAQVTQSTGNIQTFCPPATNAPYCTVSYNASVSSTISVSPAGVGIAVTGTFGAGVGVSVYPTGNGVFECKVNVTACAWQEPGHWVATQGWMICRNPFLPYPAGSYPCWGVYNVWVNDPCQQTGGIQPIYPNLALNNGMCTCFNWTAVMDKIRECPAALPPPVTSTPITP